MQSSSRLSAANAREIRFRAGHVADLDDLCAVDSDATVLFELAGLELNLPDGHEFARAERERVQRCLTAGTTIIAMDLRERTVGFAAVGRRDDAPYLDQLSVRRSHMQRGIGTALLDAAVEISRVCGAGALWLITYDHLSWNRPFYERNGFLRVQKEDCGRELLGALEYERRWLPRPELRVVMRRSLAA